jgi:glycosyltransferase involved in cell wall biosynthesis
MIGVIADPSEQDVVREFFELFKTPWEFYRRDVRYEVLLCTGDGQFDGTARLVLVYGGRKTHFDGEQKIQTGRQQKDTCILSHQKNRIPIYGDTVTFPQKGSGLLADEESQQCVAYLEQSRERVLARIGYDLFREVRTLLTVGQPPANAHTPTLELHIAFLRELITGCGIPLFEIPPVPEGYPFIACLTHDVDHPSIRQHKWDHTMFGFLSRALLGSWRNVVHGRMPVRGLVTNWAAALKLPFVHLGLANDFWREFADRYLELENGLCSTFFVIPFKNCAGKNAHGPAPLFRAARYDAQDIGDTVQKLLASGCEVGLHGIDAWLDSSKGSEELEGIRRLTGVSQIGVRMHWLYYDQQSPLALEKAGAAYDSSVGYNETVGYRAGTTQVYKPFQASRLLELPLHAMDTALFSPAHLGLSPREARDQVAGIIDNAIRLGGCVTVNWHDRSIAPERLWDDFYVDLVDELKKRGAWFSTAAQAVSWFRKRRSAVFENVSWESGAVRVKIAVGVSEDLPDLQLRVHNGGGSHRIPPLARSPHSALVSSLSGITSTPDSLSHNGWEQMQKEKDRVPDGTPAKIGDLSIQMTKDQPHVSVCICTFKRPDYLKHLLEELRGQDTGGLFTVSIVVADNDQLESAKAVVTDFTVASPIPVRYCLEPRQNIALARNKAIENANGNLVAFIDDDETPAKGWLLNLFTTLNEYEADGVLGPVKPHFHCEPPQWVVKGEFFERATHATGHYVPWPETRTGNVLFRRDILNVAVPFRPEFGTAGEDVDFFRRMIEGGCRFVWCNDAVVYEAIPPSRCNRTYLMRRALLQGGYSPKHPRHHLRNAVKSLIALPFYMLALPILAVLGQDLLIKYLTKLLYHTSRLLALVGLRLVTQREM